MGWGQERVWGSAVGRDWESDERAEREERNGEGGASLRQAGDLRWRMLWGGYGVATAETPSSRGYGA